MEYQPLVNLNILFFKSFYSHLTQLQFYHYMYFYLNIWTYLHKLSVRSCWKTEDWQSYSQSQESLHHSQSFAACPCKYSVLPLQLPLRWGSLELSETPPQFCRCLPKSLSNDDNHVSYIPCLSTLGQDHPLGNVNGSGCVSHWKPNYQF